LLSPQPDTDLGCGMTTNMGLVHHTVCLYVPAFDGAHCTCPRWDGQAEFTWTGALVGYIKT